VGEAELIVEHFILILFVHSYKFEFNTFVEED